MRGTLASDSNNVFSPFRSDSTVNYTPHKYFLNFMMEHLTVDDSPTKLCLEFSCGDTVDIDIKKVGHRCIPSRYLSNLHFSLSFSCASNFIASIDSYDCIIPYPIPSLDQYILMYNLLYGSGLTKVCPDTIYFFSHSSNLWSFGVHRLYISSIYSF